MGLPLRFVRAHQTLGRRTWAGGQPWDKQPVWCVVCVVCVVCGVVGVVCGVLRVGCARWGVWVWCGCVGVWVCGMRGMCGMCVRGLNGVWLVRCWQRDLNNVRP